MLGVEIYKGQFLVVFAGRVIGALSVGDCGFWPAVRTGVTDPIRKWTSAKTRPARHRKSIQPFVQPRCLKSLLLWREVIAIGLSPIPRVLRLPEGNLRHNF